MVHDKLWKGTVVGLVLLVAAVGFACGSTSLFGGEGGGEANAGGAIRPTWITPTVNATTASIPTSEAASGKMLHFKVATDQGNELMNYMAYSLNGETYVRANVCPPCNSVGFSLKGDTLVCNSCGTTFKASTGGGISGGCRAYPKAEVDYSDDGSSLTMNKADLVTAYQNTRKQGWP